MSMKRIIGLLLTIAGLIGLIYGAMDLTSGGVARASLVYLVLGGIFFFSGIGLIRGTKDEAI